MLSYYHGVIPISLLLLATGTVLRKAAIDRGVRLATGRYGCRFRGGHELNASGGVIAYVLSSTHAIEFFQEDMCYLSDKLFRVCDLEKPYKLQVLSKNPVFIDYH